MISHAKIEKALARIDDQRHKNRVGKTKGIIAEVEKNIKANPFSLVAEYAKLEGVYADGTEDDQKLYQEIQGMLAEAIEEHTKILIDHAKAFIDDAK